ncbi:MAG: hypothetical protein ACYS5V_17200, partial [Planctomycetota bacterium]
VSDPRLVKAIGLAEAVPDWACQSLVETGRAEGKRDQNGKVVVDPRALRWAEWRARAALLGRLEKLPLAGRATVGEAIGPRAQDRAALLAALIFPTSVQPAPGGEPASEVKVQLPLILPWRLLMARQLARETSLSSQPAPRSP